MKKGMRIFFVLITVFAFIGTSVAIEKATEQEVISKCKEAAELYKSSGKDAAIKAVADRQGPFVWKDTYVFTIDLDKKTVLAHPIKPGLVGKNLVGIKDINGKMFFAEFIKVAKSKGEGWVDYMWPRPGEKKPSPKRTYVYRVPGENVAMCAGIYK
jgi:signal transduction histidine kinase